jgi:hypothetical protein
MKTLSSREVKQALWEILEQLPPAQRHQVLDFARFLYQQVLTPSPLMGRDRGSGSA